MPPAALPVDPAVTAARLSAYGQLITSVAAMRVTPLDEKQPEADWPRWRRAIDDALSSLSPEWLAELRSTAAIPAMPVYAAGRPDSHPCGSVSE